MARNAITYHGVTQAIIDCLKVKLQDGGVNGVGTSSDTEGELTSHGITADYLYDPINQMLTITITHKPFFVSCGEIVGKIHDALTACGDLNP